MNTPEHITRIIERLDPVDRETLELHLNSQEQKHKDLLRSYQDLQALRNRSGVDLEHALRGTVREGAWQPDDTLKRVAALSQERNALGRERNELSASCHQLTKALRWVVDDVKADDPEMWGFAERVLAATPATHLAEVRAQAVEEAAVECQMAAALTGLASGMCRKSDLYEYANRIRKEAP